MLELPVWISGQTRSGKTTRLIEVFRQWSDQHTLTKDATQLSTPEVLVFAANDDTRRELATKLSSAIAGRYPILSKTPLGFFSDEVTLFWPLLFKQLNVRAQFPLRLRPETEQALATELWQPQLASELFQRTGIGEYRLVRRILDLLQLAGASGTPLEDILPILKQGLAGQDWQSLLSANALLPLEMPQLWEAVGQLLQQWKRWCLQRGFLTYGIIYELYWRYLLPNAQYQAYLTQRYQAIFADDVDDYPAIARHLFDFLLDQGATGVFTYNPHGAVRFGLNADPEYLQGLASRCQGEILDQRFNSLAPDVADEVVKVATNPFYMNTLPSCIQSIQTTSRADLLRETAKVIIDGIQRETVKAGEVAVIAPGLDAIARYSLIEILTSQGIAVDPLNEQRSLRGFPLIRALLTLLCLVYSGLGRLLDKDSVAEMLVVLSQKPDKGHPERNFPDIDPVRAGLIADHCFLPDISTPHLLGVDAFPRWDRLGQKATKAYLEIKRWIEEMRQRSPENSPPKVPQVLEHAIHSFLWNGSNLPYEQLSVLRELMETAQHYWEVQRRLQTDLEHPQGWTKAIADFIVLLRGGTITANAYPLRPLGATSQNAVTLATIYQYRSIRRSHRWQFWLDIASPFWLTGGSGLFGAPLFLKSWSGHPLSPDDQLEADEDRLKRVLRDLLGRVTEQVYLCHSDLAVNGSEQTGLLLSLVHASIPDKATSMR